MIDLHFIIKALAKKRASIFSPGKGLAFEKLGMLIRKFELNSIALSIVNSAHLHYNEI